MKRAALLATLLTLVVCGTAQAQPWLNVHRAKVAIQRAGDIDVRDGIAASASVAGCWHHGRDTVVCWITETDVTVEGFGPGAWRQPYKAIQRHDRVRVVPCGSEGED